MVKEYEPGATIVGVVQWKPRAPQHGLGLEVRHGRIYVSRLGGAFAANPINPVRVGDQLMEVEGTSVTQFRGVKAIRRSIESTFKENKRLSITVYRPDPEDTSDSTDSSYVPESSDDEDGPKVIDGIVVGETYQVRKLPAMKELNGSLVRVMGRDDVLDHQLLVEILEVRNIADSPKIGTFITAAPGKLFKITKPGIRMRLRNLKGEEAMYNGCSVMVVENTNKQKARWLVKNPVEFKEDGSRGKKHKVELEVFGKNLEHEDGQ
ncbi:unnamed protein product [Cylindrotheca closterium]|uniref:PDZ domain-containing protein n=1 Tax=Cylindrotheca closterium TaxID=2856 RepID=A0AAD2GBB5_9STRA|nr:unnamed protein product [Cylindrotheca closterium]